MLGLMTHKPESRLPGEISTTLDIPIIPLYYNFSFIFIHWRLITLQYCSVFCHTLTWISHGFTCVPHLDPPSCLPLHPIPLGLPSAPALSGRNWRGIKEPLDEGERGEWKILLKIQHSKIKIMATDPIISRHIDGKKMETVTDFIFFGSKITMDSDCSHTIKRNLFLGRKSMTKLDSILKAETSYCQQNSI